MLPHQRNVLTHYKELFALLFGQLLRLLAPQQLELLLDAGLHT
jgi:hypothetical protein